MESCGKAHAQMIASLQIKLGELTELCRELKRSNCILKRDNAELKNKIKQMEAYQNPMDSSVPLSCIKLISEEEQTDKSLYYESYRQRLYDLHSSLKYLQKCYAEWMATGKCSELLQNLQSVLTFNKQRGNTLTKLLNVYRQEVIDVQNSLQFDDSDNFLNPTTQTVSILEKHNQMLRRHIKKLTIVLSLMVPQLRKEFIELKKQSKVNHDTILREVSNCLKKHLQPTEFNQSFPKALRSVGIPKVKKEKQNQEILDRNGKSQRKNSLELVKSTNQNLHSFWELSKLID